MKDINIWAKKMQKIGRYKEDELKQWHKTTTLRQRIRMTEELLLLNDTITQRITRPPLFISLSKLLEKQ